MIDLWRRLPVIIRALIAGAIVLMSGQLATGPLVFANLKFHPEIPWSVPLLALYMWFFWQYWNGQWWPRSTSEARRGHLRATPLSGRVWFWALLTGVLATISNFALHRVVARLTPLRYAVPEVLQEFPFFTLLMILLMASVIAGIIEEAAFRGYMQGPIERRHGVVTAITIMTVVFGLAHLGDMQPAMTAARMFFILLAGVLYGVMVHLTDSIKPGIVLHAAGDAVGICWIWWLSEHPRSTPPSLLWNGVVAGVFGVAAVWTFVRLARVATDDRQRTAGSPTPVRVAPVASAGL